ncbi:MAG: hypothetical protein FK734_16730 [Asgard group archaeon]|nr:hypothetical protein [Asgard group archaeon]
MRINKTIVLLSMLILLSPMLSTFGKTSYDTPTITPRDFDSSVGVVDGDVLYYDITEFSLPEEMLPENVTFPDFAGNTLFVKVMYVQTDFEFDIDVYGTIIYYALGLIFEEDEVFTFGTAPTETNIIIPEGAATPSIILDGLPHFNSTYGGGGPIQFFLNDDWTEHDTILDDMGFDVSQTADTLHATITDGVGELTGEWRKSDGVLTYFLIDNVNTSFVDFTGIHVELQFNYMENNPLPVSAGDNIQFNFDTVDVSYTGTGDLYSYLDNSTGFNEEISTINSLEGKTFMKMVVNEVKGCWYLAESYNYDFEEDKLVKSDYPTIFNGFIMSYVIDYPPDFPAPALATKGLTYDYYEGLAPWITPDWRIYEGQMKLLDTLLGVYFEDLIEFMDVDPEAMLFNTLAANLELLNKRDFYFFREAAEIDIDDNAEYSSSSGITIIEPFMPQVAYDAGMQITGQEEAYVCYDSTGVGAVIRAQADITVLYYDTVTLSDFTTGSVTFHLDIKLANPELNPPEIIGNNFIPGFTWLISIPAIFIVAIISIVRRKRA